MTTKQDSVAAGDISAVQLHKRGRPEKPDLDWSRLPSPAVYRIMKSLLPTFAADVFSAASVCRAWDSVFKTSSRDLLLAMPALAVSWDLETLRAVTDPEGRHFKRWREPPLAAGRPWLKPRVRAASHGYLFVADAAEDRLRNLFLVEAIAAVTGEETHVVSLPRFPFDFSILKLLLTAHPASPQCVVVLLLNETFFMYCRVGDDAWTRHGLDVRTATRVHELCAAMSGRPAIAVDGKLYAATVEGRLVVVDSFFPHLNISVLDMGGFPPEDSNPLPLGYMVESGRDILYIYEDTEMDEEEDDRCTLAAFRADLRAREWVRADGLVWCGSRTLLLDHRESLSWDAGSAGDEGRVYARGLDYDSTIVHQMKHGLVEHWVRTSGEFFFLPSVCYLP